jgi:FtsH-binding integral membrane protein
VLFFVCIAYVAVFRAQDTLELIAEGPDGEARRKRYESIYFWLGVGMIVFPAIGVVLESILGWGSERKTTIFFVETAGVVLFAVFWFVKTRELAETDAEGLAVEGKVETPPQGAVELFAEKRVTRLGSPLRK